MIKLSTQDSGHDKSCVALGEARPCAHDGTHVGGNGNLPSELRTRMNTVTYSLRTVQIDPEMGTVNKSKETYCKSTSRMPRFHRLGGPGTRLSTRTARHFPLPTLCTPIINLRGIFYCAQHPWGGVRPRRNDALLSLSHLQPRHFQSTRSLSP